MQPIPQVKIKKLIRQVEPAVQDKSLLALQVKRKTIVDPTGELGNSTTTTMRINTSLSRLRLKTQWPPKLRLRQNHQSMLLEEPRRRLRLRLSVMLTHP